MTEVKRSVDSEKLSKNQKRRLALKKRLGLLKVWRKFVKSNMVAEGRFSSAQRLQAEQACLRTAPVHAVEEQEWFPRQSRRLSADNQESRSESWRSQSQSWPEARPRLVSKSGSWRSLSESWPEAQLRPAAKSGSWESQSDSWPEARPRLESKSESWKSWAEHQCDWEDHEGRAPESHHVTKKRQSCLSEMGMGDLADDLDGERCASPCVLSFNQDLNQNQGSTKQHPDSSSESESESGSDSRSESSHEADFESDIDSESELPCSTDLLAGPLSRISRVSVNMISATIFQDNAAMSDDEEGNQNEPGERRATSNDQGQMVPAEPIPDVAIRVAQDAFEAAQST